jgi:AcrR family transcriptional regulator
MVRKKKIPTVKRRTPMQERAQVTVSLILEASARILRSEGRTRFNTNKVAERAGISIGTLYGYFPNKDAIFLALARRIIEDDGRELMKVLDGNHGAETVRQLVRVLIRRTSEDRVLRRTVLSIYVAEGFGAEHDTQVEAIIEKLLAKPERLFGRELPPIDPVRLFTVTRAIIGISRALTELGDVKRFPLQSIEDEAVSLISKYLF